MLLMGHLVTRWTRRVSVWYNSVNLHVPQHIRIFCLSIVPIWQMLTWFVSGLDFDHNVSIFPAPPQKFHRPANLAITVQKSSSFKIYRCKDLRSMNIGWTHKCADILPSQAYRVGRVKTPSGGTVWHVAKCSAGWRRWDNKWDKWDKEVKNWEKCCELFVCGHPPSHPLCALRSLKVFPKKFWSGQIGEMLHKVG